jgi:hypothetical protein
MAKRWHFGFMAKHWPTVEVPLGPAHCSKIVPSGLAALICRQFMIARFPWPERRCTA